ncbi:uncharacterized protein [Oryctolagus cuniculus]|uniref:uncharacterized protein n=1 Tax=Oryctolagus cuniculus TaxID=9986 RepID=UPI003879C365
MRRSRAHPEVPNFPLHRRVGQVPASPRSQRETRAPPPGRSLNPCPAPPAGPPVLSTELRYLRPRREPRSPRACACAPSPCTRSPCAPSPRTPLLHAQRAWLVQCRARGMRESSLRGGPAVLGAPAPRPAAELGALLILAPASVRRVPEGSGPALIRSRWSARTGAQIRQTPAPAPSPTSRSPLLPLRPAPRPAPCVRLRAVPSDRGASSAFAGNSSVLSEPRP